MVPDIGVAGVVLADGEDFFVEDALVEHFEQADGADLLDAAGEGGAGNEDEHVEGVAVVGEGEAGAAVAADQGEVGDQAAVADLSLIHILTSTIVPPELTIRSTPLLTVSPLLVTPEKINSSMAYSPYRTAQREGTRASNTLAHG